MSFVLKRPPDGLIALAIREEAETPVIYYICKDHLGSITGIMNSAGTMLEEYNYDPWGRRRNPADWSYTNVVAPTYTRHGFTGHEHLDMFNLIQMLSEAKSRQRSVSGNGRIYDSEIARFLSPDPYIQDLYNLLNYNRYSYCLNNPLKYTDHSGMKFAQQKPDALWINPGWMKYAGSHIRFQFMEGAGGGKVKDPKEAAKLLLNSLKGGSWSSNSEEVHYYDDKDLRYIEGSYSYDKTYIRNIVVDGVRMGGSFSVTGNANIYLGSDGKYYANVSATGYTGSSKTGDVQFSGSVDLLVNDKIVNSYNLQRYSGLEIIIPGRMDVGNAVFELPKADGDVYLRFNVGFSYSEGAGYVPVRQGHYTFQVGYYIDAWSY